MIRGHHLPTAPSAQAAEPGTYVIARNSVQLLGVEIWGQLTKLHRPVVSIYTQPVVSTRSFVGFKVPPASTTAAASPISCQAHDSTILAASSLCYTSSKLTAAFSITYRMLFLPSSPDTVASLSCTAVSRALLHRVSQINAHHHRCC